MRALAVAAGLAPALALAGCGGGRSAADASELAPASTVAFVRAQRGPALAAAERMLGHVSPVPGALRSALRASGLHGRGELELAEVPLGRRLVWVAYVHGKLEHPPPGLATHRERGWTAVARSQAALDAARGDGPRLAGTPGYRPPPHALAGVYATERGARLLHLPLRTRRASVALAGDRLTVREAAPPAGPGVSSAAASALDDRVGLAVGLGPWQPTRTILDAVSSAYGLDAAALRRDLPPGSTLLVRPGELLPQLTLTGAAPPAAAKRLVRDLTRDQGAVSAATVDGVAVERVSLGAGEVDSGAWDGRFAVSTGLVGVLAAHRADGSLPLPARTEGWLLVDAARARTAARQLDRLAGGHRATAALARLGPIRRLVAWRAREAGLETSVVLVERR